MGIIGLCHLVSGVGVLLLFFNRGAQRLDDPRTNMIAFRVGFMSFVVGQSSAYMLNTLNMH